MIESTGPARPIRAARLGLLAAACLVVATACTSGAATAAPSASETVAAATATAMATPTAEPSATPTPTPSQSPTPTVKPTPVPTPLPSLAVGLCTGSQLKLTITAWYGDTGTSYAHVTAQNKSTRSCNMRGSSEAQVVDGNGKVIADAGKSAAQVLDSDAIYALAPGGSINTIVQWGNWCKSAPKQRVTVAMVQPFGLGRVVAPALGNAPIPTCYMSGSPTQVSSEDWLP